MYIHNILHNVIYIFGTWYKSHSIGGGGGGGGDCSLLFGWPEVDEDLVLE